MQPGPTQVRKRRSIQDPPDMSSIVSEFESLSPRLQHLFDQLEPSKEKPTSRRVLLIILVLLVALLTALGLTLLAAKFYDNLFRAVHGTATDSAGVLALVVCLLTLAGFVLFVVFLMEMLFTSEDSVDRAALTKELRSTVQGLKRKLEQVDESEVKASALGLRSRVESLDSLLEEVTGQEVSSQQVTELQKRFRKTVEEVERVKAQIQPPHLRPEAELD